MKLIVYAVNIHEGGGAKLLDAVLTAQLAGVERVVVVDARFAAPANLPASVRIERVAPTMLARLVAEWELRALARNADAVLCMGNLPPLLRLAATVTVFLQNRLLLDEPSKGYPLRVRLRIAAERLWLRVRVRNAQRYLVQTEAMRSAVLRSLGLSSGVVPFLAAVAPAPDRSSGTRDGEPRFDFLYVSSGLPHKNHLRLVEGWRLLAEQNIRPTLCLTLSRVRYVDLCDRIDDAVAEHRLNITNVGEVPSEKIHALYRDAAAFIYPSLIESFGLPLFEAAAAKMPIIAAELDYVRDVLDPAQTFDPRSSLSIARAVKRHLNILDKKVAPSSAAEFLREVMRGSRSTSTGGQP